MPRIKKGGFMDMNDWDFWQWARYAVFSFLICFLVSAFGGFLFCRLVAYAVN